MTVKDMDISLNVSTAPVGSKIKRSSGYKKEFFKPQFKREMKKSMSDKNKNESTDKNKINTTGVKPRIKQKSLAAIVRNNLNKIEASNLSKNIADSNVGESKSKSNAAGDKPIVAFAKSGEESSIKTILAKKRDKVQLSDEKKSLSDIFAKNFSPVKPQSILTKKFDEVTPILNTNRTVVTNVKRKFNDKDNDEKFDVNKAKKVKFDNAKKDFNKSLSKNIKENTNAKPIARVATSGKVSSLFGNNPDIPNLGQRFVKPVNEELFSGTKFTDFNLHPFMVSNLEQSMVITKLTTVQQKAIPEILSGKDVLVRSQTGSGKTLAYALPIVESLHKVRPKLTRESGLRALVVVPTRELALQTYECFLKLIKPFTWIVPGYLVGGEKRKAEKARLRKGCTILVATPGRLLDHIKHTEALRLSGVQCFVLDEADRMLDMGYEKDISGIVAALEEQKGLPRFGIKKFVKIDNDNDNSGYDPLKMLRQNGKKIFTEEDVNRIEIETTGNSGETSAVKEASVSEESTLKKEENFKDVDVKNVVVNSKVNEDDDDDEEEEENDSSIIKREYHSGTDSDLEEGLQDLPIRREKNKKIKSLKSVRDKTKMIRSLHKIKKIEDEKIDKEEEEEECDGYVKPNENFNDKELLSSEKIFKRQTILLSATLTQAVEKLAGLTMDNPIIVDAAKENLEKSGGHISEINEDLIVPQSVNQSYVVTPPKLRLVSLSAFIVGKCQTAGQHKILVFVATQDMVDYHADILTSILCKPSDEDDDDSEPLVDVEFFKLHGNMTQKERTEVFKTFRAAKSGVLLCTDVAARGLDLPKVDSVVQYTGPLSARDYVHRVGRTARAGSSGTAIIFLTPPEVGFIRMLESRRVRIKQDDMNNILDKLLGPLSNHNSVQSAAINLQNQFETLVMEDKEIHKKACKAYVSWIRFYSSYPKDMRDIFDRKELHLGHYAKSFGLRDPPQKIGGVGKTLDDNEKKIHNNRLSNERPKKDTLKRRSGNDNGVNKSGVLKKVRMLNTSEYDSGLQNFKKQKKIPR